MKKNLSIMIKPSSAKCNLSCSYCFYHSVSDRRKIKDLGFMSLITAENLLRKANSFADGGDIYIVFQGGEPMLIGLDFYKNFVKIAKELINKGKIFYSLQTNATLIDKNYADFFKENNFLIGLSLDGDYEGNSLRVDGNNKNTFDNIMNAKDILDKANVDFNILTVVNSFNVKRISKIYNFFKENNFKYLQFIPCLSPIGEESNYSLSEREFGDYLNSLFSLYYEDFMDGKYISVRYFDNLINLYAFNTAEQCGMNGQCSSQYVIEGNGNVYPCDFYCSDGYLMGNINEIDFNQMIIPPKFYDKYVISKKCEKCKYFFLCRACGCKRYRENIKKYCRGYYNFFEKNIDKLNNIKTILLKRR